ncbi:MAG: hypothetical protein ACLQBA_23000 [Candidatus Binataceae bacterium]
MDTDIPQARATEHVAKHCMVRGCDAEATFWIDATRGHCPSLPGTTLPHTFYLCLDHQDELDAREEGGYLHLRVDTGELSWIEIASYACSPDCDICRD